MTGEGASYPERPKAGDWMDDAACRGVPVDLFFPVTRGFSTATDAKRICVACPVRAECLEYALENNERQGVWGGKTYRERMVLRRDRGFRPLSTVVCGTEAGWQKHRAAGEDPCAVCRCAHAPNLIRGAFPA